jgi:hypothetical protein
MLFNIVDYYNEDIIYKYNDFEYENIVNKKLENNICFICYDEKIPALKLKNINYYIKNCECNLDIHEKCLDEWYNKHSTCPICIKFIYKKTNENYKNKKNKKIIIFVKQNINILLNCFLIFYILNCFYNLYLYLSSN